MSTNAQLAANRANAQHSTGPVTPEGKAASSQNRIRYGFTGAFRVMPWEEQEDFNLLLATFCTEHQPQNPFEVMLVEKMAQHYWLSQRAMLLQESCFAPDLPQVMMEKQLALYLRYQTTHDRTFHKYAEELRKLRNQRRKEEIGFESQNRQEAQETRRAAAENRKQEMHEARLRAVNSQTMEREIDNDIRQTIEAPLPGNVRLPFETLKDVFRVAAYEVNRQIQAEKAA